MASVTRRLSLRCALGVHDWQAPRPYVENRNDLTLDFHALWEANIWRCSRCTRSTVTDTNGLDPYDP